MRLWVVYSADPEPNGTLNKTIKAVLQTSVRATGWLGSAGGWLRVSGLQIEFDRHSLVVQGKRPIIRSGAMHYFRLPGEALWRDRLWKLKAAGYNTVDLYFNWGFHSPAPGMYDFSGIRDVERLISLTHELGLWLIARPGPYINAEVSGGGFPNWLLAQPDLVLRNRHAGQHVWCPRYMAAVRQWWEQIVPRIAKAPNLLMMQVENEYATDDLTPDYIQTLVDWSRELGVTVPLFHNDLYTYGCFADTVDLYAFDYYPITRFESDQNWKDRPEAIFAGLDGLEVMLRSLIGERPLFVAELQAGWFAAWKGASYDAITQSLGREALRITTKSLLAQGMTLFNHYMAVGGTNWDTLGSTDSYTSYDFAAPIGEDGQLRPHYGEARLLNYWLQAFPCSTTDAVAPEAVGLQVTTPLLYAVRRLAGTDNAAWLFCRNLSSQPDSGLIVNTAKEVTVPPLDLAILPWNIPLLSGWTVRFASTELVHQTESILVVKADRPVTLMLQPPSGAAQTWQWADALAPEESHRLMRLQATDKADNDLFVLLLGASALDQFWVDESNRRYGLGASHWLAPGVWGQTVTDGLSSSAFTLLPWDAPQKVHTLPFTPPPPVVAPGLSWASPCGLGAPQSSALTAQAAGGRADMDALGLYEGTAFYRLQCPPDTDFPEHIRIRARHLWQVWLNGHPLGGCTRWANNPHDATVEPVVLVPALSHWRVGQSNIVEILVDFLGHPKGFYDDTQTHGGLLELRLDHVDWTQQVQAMRLPTVPDMTALQPDSPLTGWAPATVGWWSQATFALQEGMRQNEEGRPEAMGLNLLFPADELANVLGERVNVMLNGHLIGRWWRGCQRQSEFVLPAGFLQSFNTLVLVAYPLQPSVDVAELQQGLARVQLVLSSQPLALAKC